MTFLEWFGSIALTVLLVYIGLVSGFFAALGSKRDKPSRSLSRSTEKD